MSKTTNFPTRAAVLRHLQAAGWQIGTTMFYRHTDEGKLQLSPGMCAGFKAGTGNAHTLINESSDDVVYLEIGDRTDGDEVIYPDDDLCASFAGGTWLFFHKDGTPY